MDPGQLLALAITSVAIVYGSRLLGSAGAAGDVAQLRRRTSRSAGRAASRRAMRPGGGGPRRRPPIPTRPSVRRTGPARASSISTS
jgi:hypothetical protein